MYNTGNRWQRLFAVIIIFMLVAVSVNIQSAAAGSSAIGKNSSSTVIVQQKMSQCFGPETKPASNSFTGKVNFVGIGATKPLMQADQNLSFASPEAAARGYLSECGSLFGVSDQAADLSVLRQTKVSDGRSVIRFQQSYKGVPVFGAQLLVQLTAGNAVILVNGNVLPIAKLNMLPGINASAAKQAALKMTADKYKVSVDSLQASAPMLSIYSPAIFQERASAPALVWRVDITPKKTAPIRELVLLDAHTGTVALSINQVDTAKNRETYTAGNTLDSPGSLVCNESDPGCNAGFLAGDFEAVAAHLYTGSTYDFYLNYNGRDSIDNAGMTLISTVHYDTGFCNAFWDGFQMTYGDGCPNSIVIDDVVGHELTHGVTEHESDLVYFGQQGAINESISDIWGEFIDQTNGYGLDTPEVKWILAEEAQPGGFRSMKDPTIFGDPDRMGSPFYYRGIADNDGVHWNSGVGNKAAYLITDGDTFNGVTVVGIGIPKTVAIYYEAQTNILVPSSNYRLLRDALNTACNTLIGGTEGITTFDCEQVDNATLATEMDLGDLPAPAPANDDISAAVIIPVNKTYSNSQDIIAATKAESDPFFPDYPGDTGTNTVWYKFISPARGYLTIDTIGSNFDSLLSVWIGTAGSLSAVNWNDDIDYKNGIYQSMLLTEVQSGITYYIEAAGLFGAQSLVLNAAYSPIIKSEYRKSDGEKDGWVLESKETSNLGGSFNSTETTIRLGDDNLDKQYRAILSFDTTLPAGAKITRATLKIKRLATNYLVGNNDPFTWGHGLITDVCKYGFGPTKFLEKLDFSYNNATYCAFQAGTFSSTPEAYWYKAPLTTAGIAKINTNGLTQFRLNFVKDDNDDNKADYLKFYSGNAGISSPSLEFEYYYP